MLSEAKHLLGTWRRSTSITSRHLSPVSQEMLRFAQHKLRCLPDAIVTKAYAPILIIGAAGGLIAAVAGARWSI